MFTQFFKVLAFAALAAVCLPAVAVAQTPPGGQTPPLVDQGPPSRASAAAPAGTQGQPRSSTTPCGNTFEEPEPAKLPSANIGPVTFIFELCFNKQGGSPTVDAETYTYYITFDEETEKSNPPSNNSTGRQWDGWRPYNEASEQMIRDDFRRVWDQGLLDDLSIEATDYTFSNGAIGKIITYNMEERDRVKIVTYEGSKQVDRTKIEEQLRDRSLVIAADSLLDERKIRLVEGVVREMMVEKGFNPEVSHTVEPIKNSPKTVNITFHISEGPKVKVRRVDFIGNKAFSDGKLQRQLKENKPVGMLSFITGTGTYNAAKFEEDADKVSDFYMNRGYAGVRVGQPELKELETTKSGKTKWVEIRIPISEGNRYTFGALDFEGNSRVRSEFLRTLYKVEPGEIYSRKRIIDGNNKAREVYGEVGFMEFTPFPELKASDDPTQPEATLAALVPEGLTVPASPSPGQTKPAHMDITIRVTEGEQFFVNRIVFTGNTTTRDNVIRRELGRLVESAPFDSQALKTSIRRLNQLGYFKPLEGNDKDMKVEKTAGQTNMVDVTLKLEEQNRNQLTFGAGISQYEGFFGQLAFQTSNFMGRGESLTVSLQGGERAQNYQLGFTEPFLFDRNITGGVDVHKRSLQYLGYYTQKSTGGNIVFGVPVAIFSRMFFNYSYEAISITDLNEALIDNSCLLTGSCSTISNLSDLSQQLTSAQLQQVQRNPFVADSLLLAQGGKRTISKVVPTFLHNTVDHPIFPTQGRKYTASIDVAVLGGNTQFYKPHLEGIWFFKHTSRTSLGLRGVFEYIAPLRNTTSLPVFERLFLGGEYSVRGFDIRSIGPTVEGSPVVLGGNKSLNFNAEYSFTIAQPVRLLLFYDAGQVRDFGKSFAWNEDRTQLVFPTPPPLVGVFGDIVQPLDAPTSRTEVIGKTSAFKTSTGIELRFFMPVLNVPFRLIYAWNPQRVGVLDNSLQPAKNATFKFSVGTTF